MKKFHKMELKSPSIPLFQRGRPQFPSLLSSFSCQGQAREVGRDYSFFKRLNSYNVHCSSFGQPARAEMTCFNFFEPRLFFLTDVHHGGTSSWKLTTRRKVIETGNDPCDLIQADFPTTDLVPENWDRFEETHRVGMLRIFEKGFCLCLLHNLTCIHNDDPVYRLRDHP